MKFPGLKHILRGVWNGSEAQPRERRGFSLENPTDEFLEAFGGGTTASGERVSPTSAMRVSAVFASVRVLAETVASLPLFVFQREFPGSREKAPAPDHYLFGLLHDEPYPGISSVVWRETLMSWLCLYGNAYAIKHKDGRGRVVRLQPWHPENMQVKSRSEYVLKTAGGEKSLPADDIFHVKALVTAPAQLVGLSPIQQARETIGLSIAQEKHGALFFSNGAQPGGVLEHPDSLTEEAAERLKKSWNDAHKGSSNSHGTAVLEEGMKYNTLSIPNDDSQWLESREFGVTDIARIFRVPPHMIGDLRRATFSNVEQQSIDFVVHTIRPWLVRWEQEIQISLFERGERFTHFSEFNVNALLRGDTPSRFAAYSVGRTGGWLSANDVRSFENQPPIKDGDKYLQPLNMIEVGSDNTATDDSSDRALQRLWKESAPERRARSGQIRRRLRNRWKIIIEKDAKRLVRAEIREVRKILELSRASSADLPRVEDFYDRDFPALVEKHFAATFAAFAEAIAEIALEETGGTEQPVDLDAFRKSYLEAYASKHSISSVGQIRQILRDSDSPDDDLDERLGEWDDTRSHKIADREGVQFSEAIAVAVFVGAGMQTLTWQANAGACPLCLEMDGRVVGIEVPFLSKGSEVNPDDGKTSPITASTNITHPQLHEGCDCIVSPG